MKNICVYCGSSPGISPIYADAARQLARTLVSQQLNLVYGGGNVGLMGIIADEVMLCGGHVTGVIPQALMNKEVGHHGLTQLHIVRNMHERKAMMAELSDAFIAMPGGIGTLEELFEIMTWAQLGFHEKPVGLLNPAGFYDGLLQFLNHTQQQGFMRPAHLDLLFASDDPLQLLQHFLTYQPVHVRKWVESRDL
ncbi:LOG family protein [Undibacterium oligocarboniphilum]|uniref:Cytokinin riboside 5'-monophosphate phosphoribohydrolase n=1 Tax=Undibacterium oligocarboniphilum TaxID=666702 RepID=A0A850QDR0_9BURK|nr:TIGR00730 family Rossman fold protein [Undibacterium oligocarboniphilum]MBC3869047.1 TIGR00730 family Rossman fold protein [Undibacterium oligocarboniphilum]NVO77027.1 TIGR00730 family Rossman fold protein [Undibacterium oligocarboniphilum]